MPPENEQERLKALHAKLEGEAKLEPVAGYEAMYSTFKYEQDWKDFKDEALAGLHQQSPSPPRSHIFLDLDGVMADFGAMTRKLWGRTFRTVTKEDEDELWGLIDSHPSFYYDLEPCPGAVRFYNAIRLYGPKILTACPKHDYHRVAVLKRRWSHDRLDNNVLVLPTYGGSSKHLFLQHPKDILIDDHIANIRRWEEAGGIGILHVEHDFVATFNSLHRAMARVMIGD